MTLPNRAGKPRKRPTPGEAALKMASICARSEQCSFDILQKLGRMGFTAAECTAIVKDLVEQRFIDDRRFAKAFASDKLRFARWGPRKIGHALMAKRLEPGVAKEALANLDPGETYSQCMALARSRATRFGLDTKEKAVGAARWLMGRGFSSEHALRAVRELRRQSED